MTVQYLCCLNATQLKAARSVLAARTFPHLSVRFTRIICRTASFIVLADNETQSTLGSWVESVEDAMIAAGVPVAIRRWQQAPFHSTLCTFGSDYANSSAHAMAEVNSHFEARGGFNSKPIQIDGAVLFPADARGHTSTPLPPNSQSPVP